MRIALPALRVLVSSLVVAACTRSTTATKADSPPKTSDPPSPSADVSARVAGDKPSAVPRPAKVHRATAVACPKGRGPGKSNWGPPNDCKSDAQCAQGKNGRCQQMGLGAACSYDDCYADQNCTAHGASSVCACRPSADDVRPNHCVSGNCRTDSDCGAFYCSPSLGPMGHIGGVQGYYCHGSTDTCVDDEDCGPGSTCRYLPQVGHFACNNAEVRPG